MSEPCMKILTCENESERMRATVPPMSLLTARIDTLNLTTRPYRALLESHNRTIGDVLRLTERELRAIDGIGRKSLDELKAALAARGLAFGTRLEAIQQQDSSQSPRVQYPAYPYAEVA